MRLAGKVALITGAGSGIGRASALRFAQEGASVVVVDWRAAAAAATVAAILAQGGAATAVHADVSQEADAARMVQTAVAAYGRLDILYNNAAIQVFGTIPETTDADWNRVMDVNLKGVYLGCKYAIPVMQRQGGGSIISTSSALGIVGDPVLPAYGATKGGIIAITIEPGDALIDVKLTSGHDEVVLITRDGMSIRFNEEDVRSMGRPAAGVRGINLEKNDQVVAQALVVADDTLLVAGDNGIGNRTPFDEYRSQSRGGKGIITMKTTEKTGAVVGALTVRDTDEIMLITAGGQMVRTFVKDIREAGRNTQGVKLINLDENDRLQAIAPVISEQQEDAATEAEGGAPESQPV